MLMTIGARTRPRNWIRSLVWKCWITVFDHCRGTLFLQKSWQLGPAKVGLAFLAGAFLLEGSASAESLPDILVEAAGGNVNFVITALCVAEAVALIGAIVGGQNRNHEK